MTDIVLNQVTTGYNLSNINTNFDKVQTSINGDVVHRTGGNNTMSQDFDMNGHSILNAAVDLTKPGSMITLGFAEDRYFKRSGGILSGNVDLSGNRLFNLPAPLTGEEAARYQDVLDTRVSVTLEAAARLDGDLTNKAYAEALVAGVAPGAGTGSFLQNGTGATIRTFQDKQRERITPEDFGAVGNGVANDFNALTNAANQALATGSTLYLSKNKNYFVGTSTAFTFPAITVDADPTTRMSGFVEIHTNAKFLRNLTVNRNDGVNTYIPFVFPANYKLSFGEQKSYMSSGDATYTRPYRIDLTTAINQKITWPSTDTWSSSTPQLISADVAGYTTGTAGQLYASFVIAGGNNEINTTFNSDTSYSRMAVLRCTDGVRVFGCDGDGNGYIQFKPTGGALQTISTGITWSGKTDHASWLPSKSEWTLRQYSENQWCVLFNGIEIIPVQTLPSNHLIEFIGFGMYSTSTLNARISYMTRVINTDSPGRGFLDLVFVGDSTTADVVGSYPEYVRKFLDGTLGYSVRNVRNYAQDGATSSLQRSRLISLGISGATDVIVNLGTNDVQNPGAEGDLNASLADHEAIIQYCQSNNARVTGVLFPMWYSTTQSGGTGVTTFNYDLSAQYRSAIRSMYAKYGCGLVDLTQELRPAFGTDLSNTQIDPALRDNIHPTVYRYQNIAWAVSKRILGYTVKKSRQLAEQLMPTSVFQSGWTNGDIASAYISTTAEGRVLLGGEIKGSTLTDGTTVMILPAPYRPRYTKVFQVRNTAGGSSTLIISTDGSSKVYNLGANTSISLDNINYWSQ